VKPGGALDPAPTLLDHPATGADDPGHDLRGGSMRLNVKALLLIAAVLVFVLGLLGVGTLTKMLLAGLALLAAAFLVEDLGIGRRRRLGR
jgi:hypothetical protein